MDEVLATFDAACAGDRRALARTLTTVESGDTRVLRTLAARLGVSNSARVIGITGPPGAGKSSLVGALLPALRAHGRRVAVLAIDPSSPITGGALLGDRVRFAAAANDDGVYVRSMATRGHLGGCAVATPQAVRVLDAAGFDDIIIETAGVGQSEVDIVAVADVTVVVLAPGFGDQLQAEKAGILEVPDVIVINKSDRTGADALESDIRAGIGLDAGTRHDMRSDSARTRDEVTVIRTVAIAPVQGIDALLAAIDERAALPARRAERQVQRISALITELALEDCRRRLTADPARIAALAREVLAGDGDPYSAADTLRGVVADHTANDAAGG